MFPRTILKELNEWKASPFRKPLVLRGARQTGKTCAVNAFAENYRQFIALNLEKKDDRNLFLRHSSVSDLLQAAFLRAGKDFSLRRETLIFIDEIQTTREAVEMLRYFHEEYPEIHVVAAGSLLETLFCKGISFPVGRVEYRILRPVSFREFLEAAGEKNSVEALEQVPPPDFALEHLFGLFHTYSLVGGMPEIVARYVLTGDLTGLGIVYDSFLASFYDDAEKYARNENQTHIIRHCIRSSFFEAGTRIKFHGFGASQYGSREIGDALRILEKALLINLVYPTTQTSAPFAPDIKKSPRLQSLDTGLLNFVCGLRGCLIGAEDLNAQYGGKVAEHIVGQEILASGFEAASSLRFWTRDKAQSSAEVDFLFPFEGMMIPVEVKSGKNGRLRSIHQFIDNSDCDFAVRLYAGPAALENQKTIAGKPFRLLNLPYFLAGFLRRQLEFYISGKR